MKHISILPSLSALAAGLALALPIPASAQTPPLRLLYITGGCCHDYGGQKQILADGLKARANFEVTVVDEGGRGTKRKDIEGSVYQKPDWSKGYDAVIHNECFADDADTNYIERVLAPHRAGLPGVVIHCTMHTFRALKTDQFREFLGVTSPGHGPQHPIDVKVAKPEHPIMQGFPPVWTTIPEELYASSKLWPNTVVLATGTDKKKQPDGTWQDTPRTHALIWVNTYGQARVFGTTLAHNSKTFADPILLDLFTRGILWSCHKLDDQGRPLKGYAAPK